MTATVLARPYRLSLDDFARAGGIHPHLVRRFIALDLLNATTDVAGRVWLAPAELARLARLQRLRAGLSLNYAALALVCDLLDRIDQLQSAQRRSSPPEASREP